MERLDQRGTLLKSTIADSRSRSTIVPKTPQVEPQLCRTTAVKVSESPTTTLRKSGLDE